MGYIKKSNEAQYVLGFDCLRQRYIYSASGTLPFHLRTCHRQLLRMHGSETLQRALNT